MQGQAGGHSTRPEKLTEEALKDTHSPWPNCALQGCVCGRWLHGHIWWRSMGHSIGVTGSIYVWQSRCHLTLRGQRCPHQKAVGFRHQVSRLSVREHACRLPPNKGRPRRGPSNRLVKLQRRPQGGYGLRGLVRGLLLGRKSGSDHPQLGVRYNINY